ncbi:hypothetical protein CL616_03660 [archaeon]|nr:hypothetical protein [archaeon]|tara:strand:+ start:681 stop:1268 length:588 start_codon:yes stop_codon:yes gene_type:complete
MDLVQRIGISLGALGMALTPMPARADLDDYLAMEQSETYNLIKDRAVVINDSNYKREIFDYDGAVILLVDSSCNPDEEENLGKRNMEAVFLELIDKYEDVQVDGLPIKFALLDGCQYTKNTRDAFFAVSDVRTTETIMYLAGEELDRRRGGASWEKAKGTLHNMGNGWIPLNLIHRDEDFTILYQGEGGIERVPR